MNEKYYLFHTEKGSVISVDTDKKEKLKNVLENSDQFIGEKSYKTLYEYGFLVCDNTNEDQNVYGKKIMRQYCKNNYLEITIMPTEQCNFRCVYCYENFEKPVMSEKVQNAIIQFIKRELPNRKGLSVAWFGGEPLLAMEVIKRLSKEFMSICKEMKKPYIASMTTNGYLLDLETFKCLQRLHINHFQITIDGERSTHDRQRVLRSGKPTYDQIMNNLIDIRDKAQGRLWTVSLRTNVTKNIVKDRENFKREVIDSFRNDKRFYIMLRKMWTNYSEEADAILCEDSEFEDFLEKCELGENSLFQEYQFSHDLNFTCYASNPNSYVLGADGTVYKCTYALYDSINHVGGINEKGEIGIDESKMYYWIAPRVGNNSECKSCPNYAACVSCDCPYKQSQPCNSKTLESLKYYIPQFFKLSKQATDLSEYF